MKLASLKKFPVDAIQGLFDQGDPTAYRIVYNMARILATRLARLEERYVEEIWKASGS